MWFHNRRCSRFKPYITIPGGPVPRPSLTSVFTLVPQHDTNMEDSMDWEAEWNELANNKAWVSETQLAGSTEMTVQDFRRAGGGASILPLSPFTEEVRKFTDSSKL